MRIGFDFDNTLISYYGMFYKIALEKELIPKNIGKDKNTIRDYLNSKGKENEFTELQGIVYGKEILKSKPTKNLLLGFEELQKLKENISLFIISHKTKYPYKGGKVNLREAANKWIEKYLKINDSLIFKKENIYYESSLENKLQRIKKLKLNYFFDDLPIVINQLPKNTKGVLFNPLENSDIKNFISISDWLLIMEIIKNN